jgi:hypothetical protein
MPGGDMTAQRADDQVMCLSCYKPTPFAELALNAWGVPMQRCVRCAALASGSDCEPAWAERPRRVRPNITHLPDIATFEEQP